MKELLSNFNWTYYLLIVNSIGFVFYLISMWLYSHTSDGQIDSLLTITSLLGGSLGIVIAIVIFDRMPKKENMMSRVFVSSVLVIQMVIFLIVKGFIAKDLRFAFWTF